MGLQHEDHAVRASAGAEEVMTKEQNAKCRGCRRPLQTYSYAPGRAYIPETGEQAKRNHYGGFVCSYDCDYRACVEQESSFPGAGPAKFPGGGAMATIRSNWPDGTR